tara:strand:- start:61 stop:498 length:438 start_codon:yes stop_codon:yes gene_type:complete
MKFCYVFLIILSSNVAASLSVVDITSSMLSAENTMKALSKYYSSDKVELFKGVTIENGSITRSECDQNHDSEMFDSVVCYVSYQNLPSGVVWEFYYFYDEEKWIGTNLGIIEVIPSEHCVGNIEFIKKFGQSMKYEKIVCGRPRA